MSDLGDDDNEMRRNLARDDRDFDAVLRGRVPADRPDLETVAALVEDLRSAAATPARPSAALAAVLTEGLKQPEREHATVRSGRRAPAVTWAAAVTWARFRSLRTAAKGGVIATLAVLSVTSAAAANVLPAPIQDKVGAAVETVTPWEIPRPDNGGIGKLVREKARQHGQDKDKKDKKDKVKDNNGVGTPPSSSGKPSSPGSSDKATKPSASPAVDMPKPSHPAKPTHPVKPTPPGASKAAKPSPAPGAGRPSEPGSNGRSKAAERESLKQEREDLRPPKSK